MAGPREGFAFEERLLTAMDKALSKLERVPRRRVQRERQVKRGICLGGCGAEIYHVVSSLA